MKLYLHSFLPVTRANGPGKRAAIWVRGCSLRCPGCFNPETHPFSGGQETDVEELFARIAAIPDIEGVTISGGEPLQQADAVFELTSLIKVRTKLSIVMFTGYTTDEIAKMPLERFAKLAGSVDVLITGRYDEKQRIASGLQGSRNKEFLFYSSRYTSADFASVPVAEVIIQRGEVISTGINPLQLK